MPFIHAEMHFYFPVGGEHLRALFQANMSMYDKRAAHFLDQEKKMSYMKTNYLVAVSMPFSISRLIVIKLIQSLTIKYIMFYNPLNVYIWTWLPFFNALHGHLPA
ncbi:hypothetical protein ACJX0J_025708 [Zea mays]